MIERRGDRAAFARVVVLAQRTLHAVFNRFGHLAEVGVPQPVLVHEAAVRDIAEVFCHSPVSFVLPALVRAPGTSIIATQAGSCTRSDAQGATAALPAAFCAWPRQSAAR